MEQMEINDEPATLATNPTDIASTADKMQVESSHPGSMSKTMTTESLHTLEPPLNESKEKPNSKENTATSSKGSLHGWTKDEKYDLFVAITSKGSKSINEIHKCIPTKSIDEIQEAISYYGAKASGNPECATEKSNPTDIISTADKMQEESTHPDSMSETMTTESLHTLEPPLNESKEKPSSKENTATSSKSPLDGWTKDEKYDLFVAITSKGSKSINEIHKCIPTKSIDEIQEAISYYGAKASGNPECATEKLNPTDIISTADKMQEESTHPDYMSETMTTESLHTLEPPLNESKEKPSSKENTATSSKSPLDGWTKDEKYDLYMAIKSKGSKRINEIHKCIPTKSIDEIQEAISYYWTKIKGNPESATKKMNIRKAKNKPLIPLAEWAKVLTDNFDYDDLQTEIVTALRLIADLENIPEPLYTEHIDFRKIYHQIADVMEGKPLQDDRLINEVLFSCVFDTALVGKSFLKPSTYRRILSTVKLMKENEGPVFGRPTTNTELSLIRDLVSLKNYNPLNIKEDYLVPSARGPSDLNTPDD